VGTPQCKWDPQAGGQASVVQCAGMAVSLCLSVPKGNTVMEATPWAQAGEAQLCSSGGRAPVWLVCTFPSLGLCMGCTEWSPAKSLGRVSTGLGHGWVGLRSQRLEQGSGVHFLTTPQWAQDSGDLQDSRQQSLVGPWCQCGAGPSFGAFPRCRLVQSGERGLFVQVPRSLLCWATQSLCSTVFPPHLHSLNAVLKCSSQMVVSHSSLDSGKHVYCLWSVTLLSK
jgi:hypothetical protein